jgi:sortase A
MKVVLRRTSSGRILRSAQWIFFTAAVLMLGYCAYVLVDTWWFQRVETENLEQLRHDELPSAKAGSKTRSPALEVAPHALIGRIEIVRLGLSAVVVEGTDGKSLRRAVGHIAGTAMPGESGNVGVAGHRDSFFRSLRNVRTDDIIVLTTLRGDYRYRVVSMRIVGPTDVSVLNPDGSDILTLVTCYPFFFVGNAPERFIVRAQRVA